MLTSAGQILKARKSSNYRQLLGYTCTHTRTHAHAHTLKFTHIEIRVEQYHLLWVLARSRKRCKLYVCMRLRPDESIAQNRVSKARQERKRERYRHSLALLAPETLRAKARNAEQHCRCNNLKPARRGAAGSAKVARTPLGILLKALTIDFAGARCGGGREEGSPVPLSDEAGVRACKAFVLRRLCMGAGALVIRWGDISAVACVHGKCARCVNY
jgi:hypothetical protein